MAVLNGEDKAIMVIKLKKKKKREEMEKRMDEI
jgi:hypothetical protein